jgi:hypothetical protein
MSLEESLQRVRDMVVAPPLNPNAANARLPFEGVVVVSDHVASLQYFLNMPFVKTRKKTDTLMNEFVWDPIGLQFATIRRGVRLNGSPHQTLARAIGADETIVCGGTIRFPSEVAGPRSLGVLTRLTTGEFSGHYWEHWTNPIRDQFRKYMHLRTGLIIDHSEGM